IVVANPNQVDSVDVTLSIGTGMAQTVTVAAGQIRALFPQQMGFPDQSLSWSGLTRQAYRLISTRPIVAYQFNPLENVFVYTNDASLLLPVQTLDKSYYVLSYPTFTRRYILQDDNAYATVVASGAGTTTVTVTATGRVRGGDAVPAFGPGQSQTFTLQQF